MNNNSEVKHVYACPEIMRIKMDNSISLALESPPFPGNEFAILTEPTMIENSNLLSEIW